MSPQLRSPCRRSTSTLQHFVTTGVLFIIISLTPSTKAGFTRDCQYIDVSSYNTANLCDGGLDVNVRNRCNAYNEMSLTVCEPIKISSQGQGCSDAAKSIIDVFGDVHDITEETTTTHPGYDVTRVMTDRLTNQRLTPSHVLAGAANRLMNENKADLLMNDEDIGSSISDTTTNTTTKTTTTTTITTPTTKTTAVHADNMNGVSNTGFETDDLERSAGFAVPALIDIEDSKETSTNVIGIKNHVINYGSTEDGERGGGRRGSSTLVSVDLADDRSEVEGSTLSVHDLSYKVKVPSWCGQSVDKQVLSNVTAIFKPGLNAILGPTGCGKTSFLNTLAGRVDKARLSGDILMNGRPIPNNFKCMVGYVVQDDILVGTLTVRENFAFSAALRLPSRVSSSERKRLIDNVIKELGLQNCADSKIGTPFIRGVSGGERKRCNIGMELIISPPVLFLDEPTSSLDANTANTVLSFLRRLADKGRTIIFSIHQPRYSIYKLFDRLMLLSSGHTAFHGPANQALEFFEKQGFVCQEHNNPPDFFLDVINADQTTLKDVCKNNRKSSQRQIMAYLDQHAVHQKIVRGFQDSNWNARLQMEASKLYSTCENKEKMEGAKVLTVGYATSFGHQMTVVAGRALRDMIRNPQTGLTVIGTSVFFALMLVAVFWQLDEDPITGFHDRTGVLFFMILVQLFFNLSAMDTYVKERVIFLHENCSGFYRTSVYFLVKVFCHILPTAFIPVVLMSAIVYFAAGLRHTLEGFLLLSLCVFLVSLAASATCFFMAVSFQTFAAAQLVMSLAYTLMVLFSGYMVNLGSVGDWISWLQYLSVVKYGLAGLYINEFKDRTFCNANATLCKEGNEFLGENSVDFDTSWDFWHNYLALFLLSMGLFLMTYVQLRRMKRHA